MMTLMQKTQRLQQFLVILEVDAHPTRRANQDRPKKFLEFSKMVKECAGGRMDPTAAKYQFEEVKKLDGVEKLLWLVKC